jgi:hypothetical protein
MGFRITVILSSDRKLLALNHDSLLARIPSVRAAKAHGIVRRHDLVTRGRGEAPHCCVHEIVRLHVKLQLQEIAK